MTRIPAVFVTKHAPLSGRRSPLTSLIFSAVAVATLGLATLADAAPVAINNASFEGPVVATAGTYINSVSDWNATSSGVFQGAGQFNQTGAPTDGNQIAYLNSNKGVLSQTLGTSFVANANYTLSVDVAARNAGAGLASMTMMLFHSSPSNVLTSLVLDAASSVAGGAFRTFTMNLLASDVANLGGIGNAIGIQFSGNGRNGGTSDFDLDNVRLDVFVQATQSNGPTLRALAPPSVVPVPAALPLIGSAFGMLAFMGRRRRKAA
jgi:hypothetical protein